ncbi:MAG: protein kinase [Clostridiales bacterium]|nr:protein kinase [Clostridiales bacterium]
MAFCRQCGSELVDGWQFCGNCGHPVSEVEVGKPFAPESRETQTEVTDTVKESDLKRSQPTYVPVTDVSANRYTTPTEKDLSGSTVDGKYILLSRMSSGGESDIYICSDADGQQRCIKIYHNCQYVRPEVREMLQKIEHENILPLLDWGEWNNLFYEVSPFINARSLKDICDDGSVEKYNRKELIKQMTEAVHTLHNFGIIHQDIKPENFVISEDGIVKVIDFGISGLMDTGGGRTHVTRLGRTPKYSSPQVREGRNFIGPSDDIFSLGATIYYMLFKKSPYVKTGQDEDTIDWSIVINNRIPDLDKLTKMFSPAEAAQYQDLLFGLLQYEPEKRWKYEAVADWLKGDYTKWIIRKPRSADSTAVFSMDGERFVIPDEIPKLVTTLAYKWKVSLLDLNGKFKLLADTVNAIKVEDEAYQGEKERISTICNATWTNMTYEGMRSYPYKGCIYPNNDGIYFIKLYQLYPELKEFAWKQHVSKNMAELGQNMLQVLWKEEVNEITGSYNVSSGGSYFANNNANGQKKDDSRTEPLTFDLLRDIVDSHLISIYYFLHGQNELLEQIYSMENSVSNNGTIQEGYYELAYFLSGSAVLDVHDGKQYNGLSEFVVAVNAIISECSFHNTNEPFISFINHLYAGGTIRPGFKVWARRQGIDEKHIDALQSKLKT